MIDSALIRIIKLLNSFFYTDRSERDSEELLKIIIDLEKRVSALSHEVKSDAFKEKIDFVGEEVERYVQENLGRIVSEKFKEMNSDEVVIKEEIERVANSAVREFISGDEVSRIAVSVAEMQMLKQKQKEEEKLNSMIESQMRNAGNLKTVMINLFVLVNMGILAFYIFGDVASIPNNAIYGIIGLYVSLATFIVYIYRASNSRTSALLAINEDGKHFHDVIQYLRSFKGDKELTEHDIDLIRMLMTNRAEREKPTNHPYEMLFKGISDSNIQFKGGKMSIEKNSSKDK